jgi:hypothetical protein
MNIISHISESREVQDQTVNKFVSCEGTVLVDRQPSSIVSSPSGKDKAAFWGLFYKNAYHLSTDPPLNSITLVIRFQHTNFVRIQISTL